MEMRLSSKGEYGLLALVDLALHANNGPVQVQQIARRQAVPKQYLDQLMLILKKAGLVESSRGRQGGYELARPAQEITLLEAVRALEGPIRNVNFLSRRLRGKTTSREVMRNVWDDLYRQLSSALHATTLQELCIQHTEADSALIYEI
jgi:Rrf2 family protein